MKNIKNKLLIISSLFLSLIAVLSIIVGINSQDINEYKIYISKESDISKIDVKLNNIYLDNNKKDVSRYSNEYMSYDKKEDLLKLEKYNLDDAIFSIESPVIDCINLEFSSSSKAKLLIYKNEKHVETLELNKNDDYTYSYQDSTRLTNLLFDYIENIKIGTLFIFILIYIILFFLIYFCLSRIRKMIQEIKNAKLKFRTILIAFISLFIIYLLSFYFLVHFLNILILVPISIVLFYLLYTCKDSIKNNLHYAYIIITLFIGITMLFALPPFHVPDEPAHFINSLQKSNFKEYANITKDGIEGFTNLPKEVEDFVYKYSDDTLNTSFKISAKTYLFDLYHLTDYNTISDDLYWYGNTVNLSIVPYIPTIITSYFCKILSMPVLFCVLFGKFVNLLISTFLCYLGIKLIPKFKKVLFIVSTLPIFFHQASAFNMDFLTNSVAIYFVANVLNFVYSNKVKKLENKHLLKLFIIGLILAFCKFGYFPLLFLVLLIPKEKFNKKPALSKILILIIPIIVSFIASNALSSLDGGSSSRDAYSISIIWQEPLRFFEILKNTWVNRLDLDLFRGLFDGFGWSIKWNGSVFLSICQIILILIILCNEEKDEIKELTHRITFLLIGVFMCAIIYASMFFTWTIKGLDAIDGLQPRYFIPVVIMFYICLSNNKIIIKSKNKKLLYAICMGIVSIISLMTIIANFYI